MASTFGSRGLAALGSAKALSVSKRSLRAGAAGRGWTRTDEKQYQAIKQSCLSRKPRCKTKYTKKGRVRQCFRDCERIAAATVNKRRKKRKAS